MSAIRLRGATSGTTDVVAAAIAGDGVMTLPTGTGTLATTASVTAAQADATAAGIAGGGLVAVAPTSIANSGGSASTSGNTTTFAGVTSLTLNGVFTSGYKNYTAIIKFVKSGDAYAYLRLSAAATPASGSNYQRNSIQKGSAGSITGSNGTDTSLQLGELERDIRTTVNFIGPQLAENTGIFSNLLYNENLEIRFVRHNLTTQYDGLNLTISAGNFTSGTIQVFGYKD